MRTMTDNQPDLVTITHDIQETLSVAMSNVVAQLAQKRAERDELNAQIRQLVSDQETLQRTISAYERARTYADKQKGDSSHASPPRSEDPS